MIQDWQWVGRDEVLAIHKKQIVRYGGADGIRDNGMLDSALERPKNRYAYDGVDDLFRLAASYAFGIVRNHPFVDGNKRTAFVVAAFFLRVSGLKLTAAEQNVVEAVLGLAAGSVSENDFAEWLRAATAPVEG